MANNSPVLPSDAKAVIPDSTASLCSGFVKALLRLPVLFYQFLNWLLDENGNLNPSVLGTGTLEFSAVQLQEVGRFLCNGSEKSRTTYANLFGVIGTTFGPGDGVNTFKIPDFRDRFPIGTSGTKALASTGGAETVSLVVENVPKHSHTFALEHDGEASEGGNWATWEAGRTTAELPTGGVTSEVGSDDPQVVNIMPPWLSVFIYIRA